MDRPMIRGIALAASALQSETRRWHPLTRERGIKLD